MTKDTIVEIIPMLTKRQAYGDPINEYRCERKRHGISFASLKGRYIVYLLIFENKIVYIGRTKQIGRRITGHHQKFFDEIMILEYFEYSDFIKHEELLIDFHQPILNINGVTYGNRKINNKTKP